MGSLLRDGGGGWCLSMTRLLGLGGLERRPDPFGGEREVADDDARGAGDRGAEGAGGAQQRALADALGAVGPGAVVVFDRGALQLDRDVLERRDAVVQGAEVADPA